MTGRAHWPRGHGFHTTKVMARGPIGLMEPSSMESDFLQQVCTQSQNSASTSSVKTTKQTIIHHKLAASVTCFTASEDAFVANPASAFQSPNPLYSQPGQPNHSQQRRPRSLAPPNPAAGLAAWAHLPDGRPLPRVASLPNTSSHGFRAASYRVEKPARSLGALETRWVILAIPWAGIT